MVLIKRIGAIQSVMLFDLAMWRLFVSKKRKWRMNQRLFLSVFASAYDKFVALPAQGTRGGVLIAWKSSICQAIASRVDTYLISVFFSEQEGRNWWFTGVYGPQEDEEKMMFLQELRNIHSLCNGPWLVAGDFNLIYQAANKNNANLDRAMMGRFRRFFWMMLRLRKFLFWVANTLGRMREDLPPLSDWIGLSVVLVGKISFLTQCYKVQRQQSLTIALSSWG